MINAIELRIGNWFIGGWKGNAYLQVTADHLCSWFGNLGHMCGSFPPPTEISLTPEILEKCGFKKGVYIYQDRSTNDAFILEGRRYVITKINVGSHEEPDEYYTMQYFPYPQSQNSIGARLEYLHQLQNLYFALTYKELEIIL